MADVFMFLSCNGAIPAGGCLFFLECASATSDDGLFAQLPLLPLPPLSGEKFGLPRVTDDEFKAMS